MEGLRIRIPQVFVCKMDDCREYTSNTRYICRKCRIAILLSRMREEMASAAFTREPELVHRTALRSHSSC